MRRCSAGGRVCASAGPAASQPMAKDAVGSGFAPAAENETAEREAEPECADCETADRDALAPRREALPAPEHLALLVGQRLPATLLAQGPARPQPQVQVVEDLRRLLVG